MSRSCLLVDNYLGFHNYRMPEHVLLFYTQTVRSMEMLEMVLPEDHVRNFTCVKPMGDVVHIQVHCTHYLSMATILSGYKMVTYKSNCL